MCVCAEGAKGGGGATEGGGYLKRGEVAQVNAVLVEGHGIKRYQICRMGWRREESQVEKATLSTYECGK